MEAAVLADIQLQLLPEHADVAVLNRDEITHFDAVRLLVPERDADLPGRICRDEGGDFEPFRVPRLVTANKFQRDLHPLRSGRQVLNLHLQRPPS